MILWKTCLLDLDFKERDVVTSPGVTFRMFVILEHVWNDTSRVHLRTSLQAIIWSSIRASDREQIRAKVQALLARNEVVFDLSNMGSHLNHWPTCDPMVLKEDILRTFQDYHVMSIRPTLVDCSSMVTGDIITTANTKSVLLSHYLMTSRSLPPDRPEEATLPTFVNDVNIMGSIEALCRNQGWLTAITEALDLPIICAWDAP